MPTPKFVTVIAALIAFVVAGAAQTKIQKVQPKAVSPADGKAMFMEYCAVCHGQEGKGNGPAASALKKAPADLTQITAHSSDGKFPGVHVSRYIGGDDAVQAHGTRDMPIWGDVFKSMNNQLTATQGVSNLADYVKPIQAK